MSLFIPPPYRKNWLREYHASPEMQERINSLSEEKLEISLSDLSSAGELLDIVGPYRYARYLREFYIRHPLMWFLFYRWWFLWAAPKEMRPGLLQHIRTDHADAPFWKDFVSHHPVLFILWLAVRTLFQLFVNIQAASLKILRTWKI